MKSETKKNIIFLLSCLCISLLMLEISLRFLVSASPHSWEILLGQQLPPFKLISDNLKLEPSANFCFKDNLVIDGQKISVGDLNGIHNEDPVLGYMLLNNATSINRWWQTNNIGARARKYVGLNKFRPIDRILIFGDFFAQASRLRNEEMWSHILESIVDNVEILNFWVDGYSHLQNNTQEEEASSRLEKIHKHLESYDPFYSRSLYHPPKLLSRSALFKVLQSLFFLEVISKPI